MKTLKAQAILILLLLMAAITFGQSQCEDQILIKSQKEVKSRGAQKIFIVNPAKHIAIPEALPKSRGAKSCYFVVDNQSAMDVNIFVDSVYVGFIEPHKKGYVSRSSGYSIVHCWSSEGSYKWVQQGSCGKCAKSFVLSMDAKP